MMTELPLYIVDAFTSTPFRGNPASVMLLEEELPAATMQAIAMEMNHSETAFVVPTAGSATQGEEFRLRWFTPRIEVPLCGHATLASAAVLFRELGHPAARLTFHTRSGPLYVSRDGEHMVLDFPAEDFHPAPVAPDLLAALGATAPPVAGGHARKDRNLLLQFAEETQVRRLAPDIPRLRAARGDDVFLGVIVTAPGSGDYDFVSRYFAPWGGIDEDPVTGSAHCALAPYWSTITGKREMRAFQASARGGELTVRLNGDRVELVGDAVIMAAGRFRLHPDLQPR